MCFFTCVTQHCWLRPGLMFAAHFIYSVEWTECAEFFILLKLCRKMKRPVILCQPVLWMPFSVTSNYQRSGLSESRQNCFTYYWSRGLMDVSHDATKSCLPLVHVGPRPHVLHSHLKHLRPSGYCCGDAAIPNLSSCNTTRCCKPAATHNMVFRYKAARQLLHLSREEWRSCRTNTQILSLSVHIIVDYGSDPLVRTTTIVALYLQYWVSGCEVGADAG